MLFFSHRGSREESHYGPNAQGRNRLTRIRQGRIIGGVCGGVGRYFDIDPSFVRLVWTLGTIASVGVGGLAYLMMLIFVPEEVASDTSTGTVE
ncbi:MAG: PspC domain-containing protein [Candidatus Latescibacteria bacterium]|nr:PspC domain-containing protein [Candidatus Latescibacterota bacterium]